MSDDEDPPEQGELFLGALVNPFPPRSPEGTRYEEMRAACIAFHRSHPKVWKLLERFVFELRDRGFKNAAIGLVFERIRWETIEAAVDQTREFKLNNNHRAFYSRAFMRKYPELDGFFRKRRQTSHGKPATGLPELGPGDFE